MLSECIKANSLPQHATPKRNLVGFCRVQSAGYQALPEIDVQTRARSEIDFSKFRPSLLGGGGLHNKDFMKIPNLLVTILVDDESTAGAATKFLGQSTFPASENFLEMGIPLKTPRIRGDYEEVLGALLDHIELVHDTSRGQAGTHSIRVCAWGYRPASGKWRVILFLANLCFRNARHTHHGQDNAKGCTGA